MRLKVLYVEDDFNTARMIDNMLQMTDYEMTHVHNGSGALEKAAQEHFDCILMDINLPDVDGVQVISQLKQSARYAYVPIIALTGDLTCEAECLEAGCVAVLYKPVNRFELLDAMRRYTSKSGYVSSSVVAPTNARKSVLIVDDNDDLRVIFAHAFSPEYFDVRTASDGREAIAQIDEAPPDVVILDVNMPNVSGIEVLRYVRETPRDKNIKVILVTGNTLVLR